MSSGRANIEPDKNANRINELMMKYMHDFVLRAAVA